MSSSHAVGDPAEGARRMIERAAAAARAGLDFLSVGDQHATASPYYQNVPMMGRLLAEWDDRPAGLLFLLPLWHPVLLAEQVGTLAALQSGTVIVQTGLGGGEAQFAAMGRSLRNRVGDFEECFRVASALLAGETVDSERFGIVGAHISPVPTQEIEWWMGAGVPRAMERAARLSPDFYAGPGHDLEGSMEVLRSYLAAAERVGGHPRRLVLRKDVLVAESDDEAWRAAEQVVASGYRGFPPEALVIGSPERVTEELAAYLELGYTDIAVRQLPVDQPVAVRSLELLGRVRNELRGRSD